MLAPDLGLPMANADNMAAHWEKIWNKLGVEGTSSPCLLVHFGFHGGLPCPGLLLSSGRWSLERRYCECGSLIPFVWYSQLPQAEQRLWLQVATYMFVEGRRFLFVSLWSL